MVQPRATRAEPATSVIASRKVEKSWSRSVLAIDTAVRLEELANVRLALPRASLHPAAVPPVVWPTVVRA